MRSIVLTVFVAATLSACATVSMVPTQTTIETGISAEQSRLRTVSNAYIQQAEDEAWVEKSGGLMDLARVLMDGADAAATKPEDYFTRASAQTATTKALRERIISDIDRATHGLEVATDEASRLFGADVDARSLRTDLVSYESVLVTARKARRTFAAALARSDEAAGLDAYLAAEALSRLDTSIDRARTTADRLADASRGISPTDAVS